MSNQTSIKKGYQIRLTFNNGDVLELPVRGFSFTEVGVSFTYLIGAERRDFYNEVKKVEVIGTRTSTV